MKIEFRKVPNTRKDFCIEVDSVKFSGTFCKISQTLVDVKSTFVGNTDVDCCKCGKIFSIPVDEEINFLLSYGIYSSNDERDLDKIIVEIDNKVIDFEELLQSELESLNSEYHICDSCSSDDDFIELEY